MAETYFCIPGNEHHEQKDGVYHSVYAYFQWAKPVYCTALAEFLVGICFLFMSVRGEI